MKKILVFGTFDILHRGHEHFLKEAKKLGNELIVVVGRDSNVIRFKKKPPVHDEMTRLSNVSSLPYVDRAILGRDDLDYMETLEEVRPEIVCLGYDQHDLGLESDPGVKKLGIEIKRIAPYRENEFKSSIIRNIKESG